jgi:hypothetical protein
MIVGGMALVGLVILCIVTVLMQRRREQRRNDSLVTLLDLADRLEGDLKTCRSGLQRAHSVMSLNPDSPQPSEKDARQAIDAGLRALLQQRLWIRDCAALASQQELEATAQSMRDTRGRLRPLLAALDQAQHDLDSAMRDHLPRSPGA